MQLYFIAGTILLLGLLSTFLVFTSYKAVIIAFFTIAFYLTLCYIKVSLAIYEHKPVALRDFFIRDKRCITGCIALILYAALVSVGFLLFIIPGLYLASRYYFIEYCIMDQFQSVTTSFACSNALTKKHQWIGLFLLINATILGATTLLLPVAALMNIYCYKHLKHRL